MTNIYRNDKMLDPSFEHHIYRNEDMLRKQNLEIKREFKKNIKRYFKDEDYSNALNICEQYPYLIGVLSKKQRQILFRKSLEKNIELKRVNNLLSNKIKREEKLEDMGI